MKLFCIAKIHISHFKLSFLYCTITELIVCKKTIQTFPTTFIQNLYAFKSILNQKQNEQVADGYMMKFCGQEKSPPLLAIEEVLLLA